MHCSRGTKYIVGLGGYSADEKDKGRWVNGFDIAFQDCPTTE